MCGLLNLRRLLFQVVEQAGRGGRGGGGGGERGEIHRKGPWGHPDTHQVHFHLHITSMTHKHTLTHTFKMGKHNWCVRAHMLHTAIPTQTSTHAPALTNTHTTINNTHTHTGEPHTNAESSLALRRLVCQGGVRICMAGQIFLVLNSNPLLYLSDTCPARKKKTLTCKTPSHPPPWLLGQQKTYSPGLADSFPLCLSSCKFLHLCMQISCSP